MVDSVMDELAISEFKATCLAVLKRVAETGRPVLVTKRGTPIARIMPPPAKKGAALPYGCMAGTAEELDDIVAPLDVPWSAERG